jgi:Fe-S cluster biogenesis protein NfuA
VDVREQLKEAWALVVPIVEADGGELFLVSAQADEVHVHLAGVCAGCPGSSLTKDHLLVPVIRKSLPAANVVLSTGVRVPDGAERVRA